jgi:hypothetical protein
MVYRLEVAGVVIAIIAGALFLIWFIAWLASG